LFKRRLPLGLFSWRFLLPKQSESIRFHRRLALASFPQLPRSLFLPMMVFIGLKWAFFYSPYYSFKAVRHKGKALKDETGLSLWQQYWRVLAVSMGHGLAPVEWYKYLLHQTDVHKTLWDYIYDQEGAAFHTYRNRGRLHYHEHVALLGDKCEFEHLLVQQGIPAASTLAVLPKNTSNVRTQLDKLVSQHGQLFCKRRTGNQGKGAFRAFRQEGQLQLQPRGKVPLASSEIDAFLRANACQHDYLIQPNYQNHPCLQTHSQGYLHPASTIRIISYYHEGKVYPEFAVMHWPVMDAEQQVRFYYPIAVEANSGKLNKTHSVWSRDNLDETQLTALTTLLDGLADEPLPHWSEAVQLVQAIHPLLKGVDRIAWDLILTGKRAVLLEGNSGWGGLAVCQRFGYNMRQLIKSGQSH
jgi:hypothetical protein